MADLSLLKSRGSNLGVRSFQIVSPASFIRKRPPGDFVNHVLVPSSHSMITRVYGFMGLWVYGFMGLWVYGFMGLWVYALC